MYVCTSMYDSYVNVPIGTCICTSYMCTSTCMYVVHYIHTYMYVCNVCMYNMYQLVHVCICIHVHVCMHLCMYVFHEGLTQARVNTCRRDYGGPERRLRPPGCVGARQIRSATDVAGLVFHNTMRISRAEEEQGTANTDLRWKGSAGAHQHPRDHARAGPGPRLEEGGRRMQNSTEGKTNRFRARNAARGRMS